MTLRANVLARGVSGVRVALVERLIDLLNLGIHPHIPRKGSVGASGDLAPLAHLAMALIGEGNIRDQTGAGEAVADVLRTRDHPPRPGGKRRLGSYQWNPGDARCGRLSPAPSRTTDRSRRCGRGMLA